MPVGHLHVPLGKMSVQKLCLFLIGFFYVELFEFLFILDTDLLSNISFANIFSHSVGRLFCLLTISFAVLNFSVCCSPIYFCFCFPCLRLHTHKTIMKTIVKKHVCVCVCVCVCVAYIQNILPIFSSRSFTVSGLTFKSIILLQLIFVHSVRE